MERRTFLTLGFTAAVATAVCYREWDVFTKDPIAKAAPFVKVREKWGPNDFYEFLKALPADRMLVLKKSQGLLDEQADESQLKGNEQDARDIQKQTLWLSSNVFAYYFRNERNLDYHELVMWAAEKAELPETVAQFQTTFTLEQTLYKLLFIQMWDKLNKGQREDVLRKIDSNESIKNKEAIAALGGAGVLAAFSGTVAFTGFAFYTTMSATIAFVAGAAGLTLPFASYLGASYLVGVLSGPVGWAIMGASALGGLALLGRPNVQKSTALICQIHSLKVEALAANRTPEREVFLS